MASNGGSTMGFLYACVTKAKHVLCEAYAMDSVNFSSSVNDIKKTAYQNSTGHQVYKKTINSIHFHVYVNKGFLFIVASELDNIDERAYDFLKCLQVRFTALRLDRTEVFSKHCLNQNFKTELSTILTQYNTNKKIWATQQSMQSLNNIRNQVDEVTEIMRNNIDTVLDRGEALEDMICRADDLQATSTVFHQQTNQIHRTLYWRDVKIKIVIGIIVIVILALIIAGIVQKIKGSGGGDDDNPHGKKD